MAPVGLPPPGGVKEVRAKSGSGGTLGYTKAEWTMEIPVLTFGTPKQTAQGFIVKANKVSLSMPTINAWYPTPGMHKLNDLSKKGSQSCEHRLDLDDAWSNKIKQGEADHVSDRLLAFLLSMHAARAYVNKLADGEVPLPARPTVEEAEAEAKKKFMAILPPKLKPADPSPLAQAKKFGAVFDALWPVTNKRDTSGSHTPDLDFDRNEDCHRIDKLKPGSFKRGDEPIDMIHSAYKALP